LYLLDALPDGDYTLHISGAGGLMDFSGNPVPGNDPSGDFVVHFTVAAGSGDRLNLVDVESNDTAATAQDLGVLYAHAIQARVTISGDFWTDPNPPSDTADVFEFRVLQTAEYAFTLGGPNLSVTTSPQLVDANDQVTAAGSGGMLRVFLDPGTYRVRVNG